jgi:hypothetical protein
MWNYSATRWPARDFLLLLRNCAKRAVSPAPIPYPVNADEGTLRDVSPHFGGSNHAAHGVFHRRNSQRNIDPRAILAQQYSFEVVHSVASPQLLKNSYFFVSGVARDRGIGEFDEQIQRSEAIEQA